MNALTSRLCLIAFAGTLLGATSCEKKPEGAFELREFKVGLYYRGTSEGERMAVFDAKTADKAMAYCESLLKPLQESPRIVSDLKEAQCIPIK